MNDKGADVYLPVERAWGQRVNLAACLEHLDLILWETWRGKQWQGRCPWKGLPLLGYWGDALETVSQVHGNRRGQRPTEGETSY